VTAPRRLPGAGAFAGLACVAALVVGAAPGEAADRANVPLKNWGGFAVSRDALYDDLERLAAAGLADRVLLNTKPLSRIEVARVLGRVIQRIRSNDPSFNDSRHDLEPVLERMARELGPELGHLGIAWNGVPPRPSSFLLPVDRAQVRAGFATHTRTLPNTRSSERCAWPPDI
jgi:hypothetical protein